MVTDEEIDDLARRIEREIEETEEIIADLPDYPPREDKHKTQGGMIPVEDIEYNEQS